MSCAPVLAAFLISDEGRTYRSRDAVLNACVSRWPDLSWAELERGFDLAVAMLREDAPGSARTAVRGAASAEVAIRPPKPSAVNSAMSAP